MTDNTNKFESFDANKNNEFTDMTILDNTYFKSKIDMKESKVLTDDLIKELLNSKKYQYMRKNDRINIEKNKKFKTINISPLFTYNVFDEEKKVDMTPPVSMNIDDYE